MRELTHAGAFSSVQLNASKMCWVKSKIQKQNHYAKDELDLL